MPKIAPDARQLTALTAQLGLLEQMLKPVVGGQSPHGAAATGQPPPSNVVPMPQRGPPPQQAAMVEQMLAGVDPARAGQIRALMSVASRPNVTPQDMETAVGPLLATLAPQDQGTVRMMLSMMQQNQAGSAVQAPPPALPPAPPVMSVPPEVQQALDTATARAATALEEARRVAAELVSIKDTQNQTAAAMFQQTQVMRDLLNMLKAQVPEAAVEEVEDPPAAQQDAAS